MIKYSLSIMGIISTKPGGSIVNGGEETFRFDSIDALYKYLCLRYPHNNLKRLMHRNPIYDGKQRKSTGFCVSYWHQQPSGKPCLWITDIVTIEKQQVKQGIGDLLAVI